MSNPFQYFKLLPFSFCLCFFVCPAQNTVAFKPIGKYKWVVKNVVSQPEQLPYKKYVCRAVKKNIPREKHTIYKRKVSLYKEEIKHRFMPPRELPASYRAKPIKPSQKIVAPAFLYKDNAIYNISYIDKVHGFVSDDIAAIAEDSEQNIWMATSDAGLVKYDGSYFYIYNVSSGLISNTINDLKFDRSSGLWIGTPDGVQILRSDSVFEPGLTSVKNSDLNIARISADSHHNIWVNTINHGSFKFNIDRQTIQQFDTACGLPGNSMQNAILDKQNNYWFAGMGVVKIEGSKITQWFSRKDYVNSDQCLTLLEDADTMWVGTFDNCIYKITPTDTTQLSIYSNFTGRVFGLIKSKGAIWFTLYGGGVCYMNGNDYWNFNDANGLSSSVGFSLLHDSYDNIWVGTIWGGVSRVNESGIIMDNNTPKIFHNASKTRKDKQGNRWCFLNGGGMMTETATGYELITNEAQKPLPQVWHFMDGSIDSDGTAWLASYSYGIARYDKKEITFYYYSDDPVKRVVLNVAMASGNTPWFSTLDYGLISFRGNSIYHITTANGLLTDKGMSLTSDGQGAIWCTSDKGIQKISHDTIYDLYVNDKRFEMSVYCLYTTAQGDYLIGSADRGFLLMKGGVLSTIERAGMVDYSSVMSILEDKTGILWLTNDQGIIRCKYAGETISSIKLFSARNGFMFAKIDPAGYIADDGTPYWSTDKGFLKYAPEFEHPEIKAPNIKYLHATINGTDADLKRMLTIFPNDELKLYYTIICWGNENQLAQEYALINMHSNDTIVSPIGEKGVLKFNNLNAAEYKVLLIATVGENKYYSSALPITVKPYWYNTNWFWGLCAISMLLGIFLFFRIRSLRLQKSKQELERIVSQRTAELTASLAERDVLLKEVHHRVKNNLQVISGLLELQKEEMTDAKVKAALSEGQSRVSSIALIHQNLYQHENMASIEFKLFTNDLIRYLAQVFEDRSKKIEVNVTGDDIRLDIDTAVPLGLIINELLTNAYKHATSKKGSADVVLELIKIGDGEYQLTYTDNGPGIKQKVNFETATSLGLRLIKGLIEQIAGTVSYKYNAGSVFIFIFKDEEARRRE